MTQIVTVRGQRGEYTGYSHISKKHHVSLYNGDTLALSSKKEIFFDVPEIEPVKKDDNITIIGRSDRKGITKYVTHSDVNRKKDL